MPKTYIIRPSAKYPDMLSAYSTIDDSYIGDPDYAEKLEQMGIAPQTVPGSTVSCIGFCEKENRWYGWSHRAMCSFGIGSEVKRGDCAYTPVDRDDFVVESINFWSDPGHEDVTAEWTRDDDGNEVVKVTWRYAADLKLIQNKKLHGTITSVHSYPPVTWGRGEWVAESIEDAKQMAMDFAEAVG